MVPPPDAELGSVLPPPSLSFSPNGLREGRNKPPPPHAPRKRSNPNSDSEIPTVEEMCHSQEGATAATIASSQVAHPRAHGNTPRVVPVRPGTQLHSAESPVLAGVKNPADNCREAPAHRSKFTSREHGERRMRLTRTVLFHSVRRARGCADSLPSAASRRKQGHRHSSHTGEPRRLLRRCPFPRAHTHGE